MEVLSTSTQETKELAEKVAKKLNPGAVLALYGDLGSGKTTFVRFLVEALGLSARVQSPTFVLVRRYEGGLGVIKYVNHVDLYRLISKEEVLDLGLPEFFAEEGAVTVIEWPKLAEDLLPKNVVRVYFKYVEEGQRRINVQNIH